jgi:hypothetical protein
MALIKLQFKPGVNRDQTNYSNEGGWWQGDKIRFRSGFPEKIGGWAKYIPTALIGVCREMCNWITTYSDNLMFLGTNVKVYIEAGGYLNDITPLRPVDPIITTTDTDNCVQTFSGLTTVQINLDVVHGADTGDYVTISGVTGNVGGVPNAEINANHIITVVDADSFTIEVTTPAASSVAAGGGTAISIAFEITPGFAAATAGYGWGTGTWGRDSWGLGSTVPVFLPQRDWFADNIDNDCVFNIRQGPIYYWARGTMVDPTTALATRAILLSAQATLDGFDPNAVPVVAGLTLVSQQDKHVIAFGCVPFGSTNPDDYDPMLIRWADQDNPSQWTPDPTNSAGDLHVSRGSQIIAALPTRQEVLIWTNSNLYTLQFLGTADVFGLQEYGDNISIISPRSAVTAANVVYWMGNDKFYAYTGRVETVPCTLRSYVFQDINLDQRAQVICGTNEEWNEVWWFYPSSSSTWNDRYVVYNYLEQLWYYGTLVRTAWLDTPLREFPQACSSTSPGDVSYMYNHEDGVDDDGAPLEAYIQSADFDIGDGDQFMLSKRLIPDVGFNGSTPATTPEVTFELSHRNFPGSDYNIEDTDRARVISTTVTTFTNQVFIRSRARQMAIKISSVDLGVRWQLGAPRLDVRSDGRR